MGTRVCLGCRTGYAAWLSRCVRCHGTEFAEEGVMAKNTVHGGPTNKDASPGEPGYMPSAESRGLLAELTAEAVDAGGYGEPAPELASADDVPAGPEPARPSVRDPKDAWVEYVVACGLDATEAAAMTKQALTDWHPAPAENATRVNAEAATAQGSAEQP